MSTISLAVDKTIFVKTTLILGVAITIGAASSALAAGPSGSDAELRQCIARMDGSGFGSDPDDAGTTAYDVVVGRCLEQLYRLHGRQTR
jgi:hypothetical protein